MGSAVDAGEGRKRSVNVASARIRGRACLTMRIHVGTRACTRTLSRDYSFPFSFLVFPRCFFHRCLLFPIGSAGFTRIWEFLVR